MASLVALGRRTRRLAVGRIEVFRQQAWLKRLGRYSGESGMVERDQRGRACHVSTALNSERLKLMRTEFQPIPLAELGLNIYNPTLPSVVPPAYAFVRIVEMGLFCLLEIRDNKS